MREIILNSIRTPDNTIIISRYRHDYVIHKDKNGSTYACDGGTAYLRRAGPSDYTELSVYSDDNFDVIRASFAWGCRGKEGDEPLHYIRLRDLEDSHVIAILQTQKHISVTVRNFFISELIYRGIDYNTCVSAL